MKVCLEHNMDSDEEYMSNTCPPLKIDKNILKWASILQEEYEEYKQRILQEIREELHDELKKNLG